jgi:hypothetical protein
MESSKSDTVEIEVGDVRYVGAYSILPGRLVEVRTPFASKTTPIQGIAPGVLAKQLLRELVGPREGSRTQCSCRFELRRHKAARPRETHAWCWPA